MNADRRKKVEKIVSQLQELSSLVEGITTDQENAHYNIPGLFKKSDASIKSLDDFYKLCDANSHIRQATFILKKLI